MYNDTVESVFALITPRTKRTQMLIVDEKTAKNLFCERFGFVSRIVKQTIRLVTRIKNKMVLVASIDLFTTLLRE